MQGAAVKLVSIMIMPIVGNAAAMPGAKSSPGEARMPRISVSSVETENLRPELIADGDTSTRWSSAFEDNQWIVVDLREPVEVRSLTIAWNTAAAARYTIETSLNGADFEAIETRVGDPSEQREVIEFKEPVYARAIRLMLHERTTGWGFSIHEMLINGVSLAAEDLPEPPADALYRDASQSADVRARDAVARMSLREKIRMLSGEEMFYFSGNERLGLDRIFMADASMGLRLPNSTAFPAFVGLASTFDPELAHRYGAAVAEECRAKGVHVLLGPGVNLYRQPQGGRNFEYLGEDPHLASRMVVEYIKAVEARGVMATVKHFAVNNHEWHRKASNSVVDERTLRELYFPAFEAAIKEAGVGAVMTAYNLVNGEYAAQHPWLINGVLRDEWGFEGLVMTDWWSVYDPMKMIKSGVNLEMPHGDYLNVPAVTDLIASGLISESEIDRMVEGTIRAFFSYGFYDRDQADPNAIGFGGPHNYIAIETARKGMVLARNEADFLPLDRDSVKRVVVLGVNARETETSGYGAARVEPIEPVFVLDAIRQSAGADVEVLHFDTLTPEAHGEIEMADAVFVSVATREREANDRPFDLNPESIELIRGATSISDRVGVLLSVGSGVEMASWIDETQAVLLAWFAGNKGNIAVGEILFGDVNPSGKMPFSIERSWSDAAAYGNFLPHDATFNDQPIWGRERAIFPVEYEERLLMGYRHFDANNIEPLFGFGHGLSYTTFSFEGLEVRDVSTSGDPRFMVRCTVRNDGKRSGAEVAQLYIGQPGHVEGAPLRALAGFERVELDPGDSRVIEFEIGSAQLRYFDESMSGWNVAAGTFSISVGASSRDLPLRSQIELGEGALITDAGESGS